MKKKIIIFPGNYLPHLGGLETHVDELANYLSKKDYDITIFTPNVLKAKEKEVVHNNVKVIRYPAFELIKNFPFPNIFSLKFYKLYFGLYKNDYDIVMTRTRFFTNSFLGVKFAKFRLKRIKLVHVEHGSSYVKLSNKFFSFLSYLYDKVFGNLVFILANKNISISETVDEFVKKSFFNTKNTTIIRRGIDFTKLDNIKIDNKLRQKFKDKIIITTVSRLYKWKGLDQSIHAFKMLDKKTKDKCVYLICGDGEDTKALKKRAEDDLDKNIFFMGRTSFERSYQIMKTSDIYLHPSYPGGGLSSSLLSAMYLNSAIVASPYEGAREVVNSKCGILLEDNKSKNIAESIEKIVKNKSKISFYSKNSNKMIKQDFSWDKVIEEYEQVFNDL